MLRNISLEEKYEQRGIILIAFGSVILFLFIPMTLFSILSGSRGWISPEVMLVQSGGLFGLVCIFTGVLYLWRSKSAKNELKTGIIMVIISIGILPFPCYWIILFPRDALYFPLLFLLLPLIYLIYGISLIRKRHYEY